MKINLKYYIKKVSNFLKDLIVKYRSYLESSIRKFLINLGFEIYKSLRFYILSYPRSGNHLLRFIIESLTGQPTLGGNDGKTQYNSIFSSDMPIYKKIDIPIKSRKPIGLKRHQLDNINETGFELDLILILRNPLEAIVSHNILDLSKKFDTEIVQKEFEKYCKLLSVFADSDKEKIIIYYSDLILKNKNALITLKKFLNKYNTDLEDINDLNYELAFGSLKRHSQTTEAKKLLMSISKNNYLDLEKKFYEKIKNDFTFVNLDKLFNS